MDRSVEKKLLEFLRGLLSRRRRFAVVAIAGCVLAAQTLLIAHGVEHTNAESGIGCALCAAAHHQAVTPSVTKFAFAPAPPVTPEAMPVVTRATRIILAYLSRAPPVH